MFTGMGNRIAADTDTSFGPLCTCTSREGLTPTRRAPPRDGRIRNERARWERLSHQYDTTPRKSIDPFFEIRGQGSFNCPLGRPPSLVTDQGNWVAISGEHLSGLPHCNDYVRKTVKDLQTEQTIGRKEKTRLGDLGGEPPSLLCTFRTLLLLDCTESPRPHGRDRRGAILKK